MGRHKKPDKLTRENAQALAAGMSYGKWKAMQQPVAVKEEKPPKPTYNVQKCAYCGTEFIDGGDKRRKYCGDRCGKAAYDRRRRERQRGE